MKIYCTIDDSFRIIPVCDWTKDIEPSSDWLLFDFLDSPYEEHMVPKYKFDNGNIVPRTKEEIQYDIDNILIPEPTETELNRADIDYLLMMIGE